MNVFVAALLLLIGFMLLVKGADWFVDGAAGVAAKVRIPQLVIGLTVVAFGTSAPELATSLVSAVKGDVGIAVGNVLGSNICNILLILGLSALIADLPVQKDSLRIDLPVLLGASFLIIFFGMVDFTQIGNGWNAIFRSNSIERWQGALMTLILVIYTAFLVVNALKKREKAWDGSLLTSINTVVENEDTQSEIPNKKLFARLGAWYDKMKVHTWFLVVVLFLGLGIVVGGATMAVEGAKVIAAKIGIPQKVIGLTVVALGTSLPELITSAMAAKKGETDIAVGNIVGSSIFNILFVVGLSSVIMPLPFSSEGVSFFTDGMIAFGAVALLAFFAYLPGHKIKRWQGIVMLVGAVAYYSYLVIGAI